MIVGFIGLGNVGGKLANSLLRNKFNLTVIDINSSLAKKFVDKGASTIDSPKELAQKVIEKCLENGLILFYFLFTKTAIRITPPLTIEEKDIIKGCNIIKEVLGQ